MSSDRRHVAWFEKRGVGHFAVVCDGREAPVPGLPWKRPPLLSRTGRLAYDVKTDLGVSIVLDGAIQSPPCDGIRSATFSPDGHRFAYEALSGGRWRLVADGEQFPDFDWVAFKGFTPDSQHVVYVGKQGDEYVVMIDNKDVAHHTEQIGAEFATTPDGSLLAYPIAVGDRWAVMLGGELLRPYYAVFWPTFSPDGSRFVYAARREQQVFVVEQEKEGDVFDSLMDDSFLFSPDSRHFEYAVQSGEGWHIVKDGIRTGPYAGILDRTSVFSRDGERFAYAASLSQHDIAVVVDGETVGRHRRVSNGSLAFGPDGRRFAYGASDQPGHERVMLDGSLGPSFDVVADILPRSIEAGLERYAGGASIIFDSPSEFHYLAVKSSAVYLVDENTGTG